VPARLSKAGKDAPGRIMRFQPICTRLWSAPMLGAPYKTALSHKVGEGRTDSTGDKYTQR